MSITRQQFQDLMDASSAAFFIKDLEGTYLYINKKGEDVFHVTKEKIVGLTDYDVWSKELAEKFRAKDKLVIDTGKSTTYEHYSSLADGSRTYIVVKFPMRDAEGKIYALCGIGTDITEIKQAHEEISKLNVDLNNFIYTASHE